MVALDPEGFFPSYLMKRFIISFLFLQCFSWKILHYRIPQAKYVGFL